MSLAGVRDPEGNLLVIALCRGDGTAASLLGRTERPQSLGCRLQDTVVFRE